MSLEENITDLYQVTSSRFSDEKLLLSDVWKLRYCLNFKRTLQSHKCTSLRSIAHFFDEKARIFFVISVVCVQVSRNSKMVFVLKSENFLFKNNLLSQETKRNIWPVSGFVFLSVFFRDSCRDLKSLLFI